MCHSADTNPRWAQPQKFNGQLKPSSLRRRCRQSCGALASEQQHASFSCGTNVFHHPFRYHHGWNAPILQFFKAGNKSHSSPSVRDNKSKCQCSMIYNTTFKWDNKSWWCLSILLTMISGWKKIVCASLYAHVDFYVHSKGSILSQEANAWFYRRERTDGTHLRGIFKFENTHHWTNAAFHTTRAMLTVVFYA